MSAIHEQVTLLNTERGSNKIYVVALSKNESDGYDLTGHNGPRGGTLKPQPKLVGVSLESAQEAYAKLVKRQLGRGYFPIDGNPQVAAAVGFTRESAGGSLNQPVFLIGRNDVTRDECTANHIIYKGEANPTTYGGSTE